VRFGIPLLVLAALVAMFWFGLHHDPREIPSPLIGKSAPAFNLPALTLDGKTPPAPRMTQQDLRGHPRLVNFFASWCGGCQEEHPYLMQLASQGVEIVGVDYKDTDADVARWLAGRGDPYAVVLGDTAGLVGIDWGVYGVPETFVIDANGRILYKQIGPMTPEAWHDHIQPLMSGAKTS
jgi:cytochrome c biogenesis protein CcmG/thiol:disulfide interchange protein DsbE